jgi:hypothetical protein
MRNTFFVGVAASIALAGAAPAQSVASTDSAAKADTAVSVSYGAFVDSYYAYDFSRPKNLDRSFTTQAARHNEFNVNLAFVEAKLSATRLRGRVALQTGTSVQSNYSGEPTIGSVSGPSLSRFIQEAVAGYRINPNLWIDGGIFLSHIGMESFISRDNLTYTRSLSAEYTPYYESGAKLTWQASPRLTGTFVVMNGWQNISENNNDKAVGARLDLATTPNTTFSYYNFVGEENATSMLRIFNGVGVKTTAIPRVTFQANGDYGVQDKDGGGRSSWYSAGVIAKVQPTPAVGVSGRLETYRDPDQVIIVTGTEAGFKGETASIGLDVQPLGNARAMWRSELRGSWTTDPVFPARDTGGFAAHNYVVVTSLAVTF